MRPVALDAEQIRPQSRSHCVTRCHHDLPRPGRTRGFKDRSADVRFVRPFQWVRSQGQGSDLTPSANDPISVEALLGRVHKRTKVTARTKPFPRMPASSQARSPGSSDNCAFLAQARAASFSHFTRLLSWRDGGCSPIRRNEVHHRPRAVTIGPDGLTSCSPPVRPRFEPIQERRWRKSGSSGQLHKHPLEIGAPMGCGPPQCGGRRRTIQDRIAGPRCKAFKCTPADRHDLYRTLQQPSPPRFLLDHEGDFVQAC